MGDVQIRKRPWPGIDGKCIEYEFRNTKALGFDPVRVLRGEPGESNTCHANWRDGRFRSVDDVEAMADLLNAAAGLMREIEDD